MDNLETATIEILCLLTKEIAQRCSVKQEQT